MSPVCTLGSAFLLPLLEETELLDLENLEFLMILGVYKQGFTICMHHRGQSNGSLLKYLLARDITIVLIYTWLPISVNLDTKFTTVGSPTPSPPPPPASLTHTHTSSHTHIPF